MATVNITISVLETPKVSGSKWCVICQKHLSFYNLHATCGDCFRKVAATDGRASSTPSAAPDAATDGRASSAPSAAAPVATGDASASAPKRRKVAWNDAPVATGDKAMNDTD